VGGRAKNLDWDCNTSACLIVVWKAESCISKIMPYKTSRSSGFDSCFVYGGPKLSARPGCWLF
jgi:hypothetical protein